MLDSLRPTAAGLDNLPAWFLRLAAPVLCGHVADLINVSQMTSTVPRQWKQARIQPVPKVPSPHQGSDHRPISVTPVLTRLIDRGRVQYWTTATGKFEYYLGDPLKKMNAKQLNNYKKFQPMYFIDCSTAQTPDSVKTKTTQDCEEASQVSTEMDTALLSSCP